jgi:hypothetical protein
MIARFLQMTEKNSFLKTFYGDSYKYRAETLFFTVNTLIKVNIWFSNFIVFVSAQRLNVVVLGISKSFDFYRKRPKIFLIFPQKSKIGEKIKRIPYKSEGK